MRTSLSPGGLPVGGAGHREGFAKRFSFAFDETFQQRRFVVSARGGVKEDSLKVEH